MTFFLKKRLTTATASLLICPHGSSKPFGCSRRKKQKTLLACGGRVEHEVERRELGEQHVWWSSSQLLSEELSSQEFNTWIRPLKVREEYAYSGSAAANAESPANSAAGDVPRPSGAKLVIEAPNRWVKEEVEKRYWPRILDLIASCDRGREIRSVELVVGRGDLAVGGPLRAGPRVRTGDAAEASRGRKAGRGPESGVAGQGINPNFVFQTFVEGNSNQLAKAAALGVASACVTGRSETRHLANNPLLVYGGVGLGKTHLMHAVGNEIVARASDVRVLYLSSQSFGNDIVRGIRTHTIQDTMQRYGAVDVLMIDDVQFFADKTRFQEELFHVFNTLLERRKQIVLTSDRYPTSIEGLESRLKSRFIGGLAVELDLPELETRIAILQNKAEAEGVEVPFDVASHIAERIRSNVRELEGALQRVIASAQFARVPVTLDLVQAALRDLFAIHNRHISVEHIQKVVAEYYKIRHSDMLTKSRSRAVARPRQLAMCLAKECTNHSLPEIGDRFGGRDHTTVLHACKKIAELRANDNDMAEDYRNLFRLVNED